MRFNVACTPVKIPVATTTPFRRIRTAPIPEGFPVPVSVKTTFVKVTGSPVGAVKVNWVWVTAEEPDRTLWFDWAPVGCDTSTVGEVGVEVTVTVGVQVEVVVEV